MTFFFLLFIFLIVFGAMLAGGHVLLSLGEGGRQRSTRRLLASDPALAGMTRAEKHPQGQRLTRAPDASGRRVEALVTQLDFNKQAAAPLLGVSPVTPQLLVRVVLLEAETTPARPWEVSVSQLYYPRQVFLERLQSAGADDPTVWEPPSLWRAGALEIDSDLIARGDAVACARVVARVALGGDDEVLRRALEQRPAALLATRLHARGVMALWALCEEGDLRGQVREPQGRARLIKQCVARTEAIWAACAARDEADAAVQTARALWDAEGTPPRVKADALAHLITHTPEAGDDLLDALVEAPRADHLALWWSRDPERALERFGRQPDAAPLLERFGRLPALTTDADAQAALALVAFALCGDDAIWLALPIPVLERITREVLREGDDAARRARVCALVDRLRAQRHHALVGPLVGLSEAGPALTALSPGAITWLEEMLWAAELPAHETLVWADAAGRILRFVGQGPSLPRLRLLHDHARFQDDRRRMLAGHITLIEDRLNRRANPGALELVLAPEQAGALTVAQEDTGALTLHTEDKPS